MLVNVSAIQMECNKTPKENIMHADRLVREAAKKGANIILLPELFERNYFCQERNYDFYEYATSVEENLAINHFKEVAKELGVVLPISFYEKDKTECYNSLALINTDGSVSGVYRKSHIPDDHYYQEKFYFKPGNTGFKVFETPFGKIGIGICWDQWFPETARCLTLMGADLICYPTAIGSEPILECDSMGHWRRTMQGHGAANIIPVIAANRYGTEVVVKSVENGNQESSLTFYGSSFIADETGEIIKSASRNEEEILFATFDFDEIRTKRMSWGLFRDRRPDLYQQIIE
ncbi:MAG: N-carbamoylputrescine amidase [Lachnospiraceae bacterium]